MEKAPLPAQPREGAKSLIRFLVGWNQAALDEIAKGDRTTILRAPIQTMVDSLGERPDIGSMSELFRIVLEWLDKYSESYDDIGMEKIGITIKYLIEELSKKVTVYKSHPKMDIEWPLPNEAYLKIPNQAYEEQLTGKPLAKLIAIELQGKLSTIVKDPESRFARELAKRLKQLEEARL